MLGRLSEGRSTGNSSLPLGAGSLQAAFDGTLDKDVTLSLSADQRVYFSITDQAVLDNRGGVSLRLVPEPSSTLLLAAGVASLIALERRRRRG